MCRSIEAKKKFLLAPKSVAPHCSVHLGCDPMNASLPIMGGPGLAPNQLAYSLSPTAPQYLQSHTGGPVPTRVQIKGAWHLEARGLTGHDSRSGQQPPWQAKSEGEADAR